MIAALVLSGLGVPSREFLFSEEEWPTGFFGRVLFWMGVAWSIGFVYVLLPVVGLALALAAAVVGVWIYLLVRARRVARGLRSIGVRRAWPRVVFLAWPAAVVACMVGRWPNEDSFWGLGARFLSSGDDLWFTRLLFVGIGCWLLILLPLLVGTPATMRRIAIWARDVMRSDRGGAFSHFLALLRPIHFVREMGWRWGTLAWLVGILSTAALACGVYTLAPAGMVYVAYMAAYGVGAGFLWSARWAIRAADDALGQQGRAERLPGDTDSARQEVEGSSPTALPPYT